MNTEDTSRLVSAIDSLNQTAKKLDGLSSQGVNTTTVSLDAGGAGVWIAVTCVVVLAFMNVMQITTILRIESKYDNLEDKYNRTQDYLNAIYAQAPQLKPKEEK